MFIVISNIFITHVKFFFLGTEETNHMHSTLYIIYIKKMCNVDRA